MPSHLLACQAEEDHLAQEDMPVTIVVKADTANALACVMDAIGDWREWQEKGTVEESHVSPPLKGLGRRGGGVTAEPTDETRDCRLFISSTS